MGHLVRTGELYMSEQSTAALPASLSAAELVARDDVAGRIVRAHLDVVDGHRRRMPVRPT